MRKEFPNLNFSVEAVVKEYSVEFMVRELSGCIIENDVYMHGYVKYTGCSNWAFDGSLMLHACTRSELCKFSGVMIECWDWAKELLENFEGDE